MKKFTKINETKHFTEPQNVMVSVDLTVGFADKIVDQVIDILQKEWKFTDEQVEKIIEDTGKNEVVTKVLQDWLDFMNHSNIMGSLEEQLENHFESNLRDNIEALVFMPPEEEVEDMVEGNEEDEEKESE